MVVPASPCVCSCTSNWSEIHYSDLELIQLKLISLAEIFVLKSVHCSLMQLSVWKSTSGPFDPSKLLHIILLCSDIHYILLYLAYKIVSSQFI